MKIAIVAPHPDDETLGCGGTILKHRASGDKVYCLIMTNISAGKGYDNKAVRKRQNEINAIAELYGFKNVFKLNFPTTKLDLVPRNKLIESISNILHKIKPNTIYLPFRHDIHSDHKITFDAAINSIKTFRCPYIKKVLMYEVISETEFSPSLPGNGFVPNNFSDISDYFDKKISILKIYSSELEEHPFPRSIQNLKALATFRGATSGVKYAEAFVVLKEIW